MNNDKNEMIFRKARLVKIMGDGDDRLQVRILPEQMEIKEKDLLPIYPSFYRGEFFVGETETSNRNEALMLWVLVTPDFRRGFILGPANEDYGFSVKNADSYAFSNIAKALSKKGLTPNGLKYENLNVVHWSDSLFIAFDRTNGSYYLLLNNGTIICATDSVLFLHIGDSDKSSSIRMTRDSIIFDSPLVNFSKCKSVKFGESGINVAGVTSTVSVEGRTISPIKGVTG